MALLRLLSGLHLRTLYLISDLLYILTYRLLRYRVKVVRQNLRNSFPQASENELKSIENSFYRNLCDYSVETIKLLTISREELSDRVVFTNPDTLRGFTDNGTSVLILTSHQFNWEWLLAVGSFKLPAPVDFVYQPQSSELANKFSTASRTRFGAHAVKRETVGREALRRKDKVRITAIVGDQFPGHFNHRRYWANFLGQRTAFFHGIAQLAVLMKSPAYYGAVTRKGRGHYEVTLVKLSDPPLTEEEGLAIIDRYIEEAEKVIRRQPEGWLWSHRRWKEPEEDHPRKA
jgi:KDO2-lipid IV(A) lauroyltransferase